MALTMDIQIDAAKIAEGIDQLRDRYHQAVAVANSQIAGMLETAIKADVAGAGGFSTDSVTVTTDGNTITTTIDLPGASLLETGGTIYGKPLLWLPFSGTDAEGVRARDYGGKLFSVNKTTGGVPLLFSESDKSPKYFAVPNVNVPKKFHVAEIEQRIMSNYAEVFSRALNG